MLSVRRGRHQFLVHRHRQTSMDDSFNLARHIARFVQLLMRQSDAVDQQKLALRAIVLMTKETTLRLSTREGQLIANGLAVPAVLAGIRDLADQMVGHRIESIEINQGMSPGDLLSVMRIVASPIGEDPAPIHKRLREAEPKTITVLVRDAEAEQLKAATTEQAVPEPAPGTPERIDFLLERANRGGDGNPIVPHFEEVAFAAEQASRTGNTAVLMDVYLRLIANELHAEDPEIRRQFVLTLRRLTKPRLLQPVARAFIDNPERAADAVTILTRCGTDGGDALVDQYVKAATRAEREVFLAAFERLPAADASLISMLADGRSHMVRAAAELVARRTPPDGDKALAELLDSSDARLRRAAMRALAAYDTTFAIDAIARGLGDPVIEVRLESVAALASRKGARVGDIIGRAMDAEEELEVQVGMIGALGRIGTPDAVAKLAKAAESGSGLFAAKRGPMLRVAAVRALAEARTAGAMSALMALANDKEREVRDVAARAIGR
jgi:HEAT repeat protein